MPEGASDGGNDEYRDTLLEVSRLSDPAVRSAVSALSPARGSCGLDAGCGIGIDTVKLAEAIGPGGSVTGVDISDHLLEHAQRLSARSGVADRLVFRRADLTHLPFADSQFDWVWCRDVLWGQSPPPVPTLQELTRVVRPGGLVSLIFWSSQVLLPGYPELEARLMEAFSRTNPYTAGIAPGSHFLRALGWMKQAGLAQPRARTFAATVQAPLDTEQQQALRRTLGMFFDGLEGQVSEEDWTVIRALSDPASGDYLPGHPDYCGLIAYTQCTGSRLT